MSKAYEDEIQPEVVKAESQDAEVTKGEVPQTIDLQQYQLTRDEDYVCLLQKSLYGLK